uniref:Heat shock protein 70 n=1 Tax=Panagrolaimus superbus TaxID=310955 RepID=A0A914YI47_9BILA
MPNAIGIDLGTSSSCVGIFQNGKVKIIRNDYGSFITPSYVAFDGMECTVGDKAKNKLALNHSNTVFAIHRLVDRKFNDPSVQSDMTNWPFKVVSSNDDYAKVELQFENKRKAFFPEEILVLIIKYLKETAEKALSDCVDDAVISVPATFNFSQRQVVKDAAALAGKMFVMFCSLIWAGALAIFQS